MAGRPERQILATGPQADFAKALRLLRVSSGLTLQDLARVTPYSTATLSKATNGEHLPVLAVAMAFAQACGGDPQDWKLRWELANQQIHARALPMVRPSRSGRRSPAQIGPPPTPMTAESVEQFMDCLGQVKIWAGDPTYRDMARALEMPHSTLYDALRRDKRKLPDVGTLDVILRWYGIQGEALDEWIYTWRRLKAVQNHSRAADRKRRLYSA